MIQNFRTYDLAVKFYKQVPAIKAKGPIKNQLVRAALSIVLNLAEGSGKPTKKDQLKFYATAFGSVREVQAIAEILGFNETVNAELDHLAACVYRLVYKQ